MDAKRESEPYVDGNGSLPAGSDLSYPNKSFVALLEFLMLIP